MRGVSRAAEGGEVCVSLVTSSRLFKQRGSSGVVRVVVLLCEKSPGSLHFGDCELHFGDGREMHLVGAVGESEDARRGVHMREPRRSFVAFHHTRTAAVRKFW